MYTTTLETIGTKCPGLTHSRIQYDNDFKGCPQDTKVGGTGSTKQVLLREGGRKGGRKGGREGGREREKEGGKEEEREGGRKVGREGGRVSSLLKYLSYQK